jgi:hypothetical protein
VSVSVQTTGASASAVRGPFRGILALAAVFLIPAVFLRRKWCAMTVVILTAAALPAFVGGCGGGGGSNSSLPPAPVVSTLTVSASGPGVTMATQTLTLTVQ